MRRRWLAWTLGLAVALDLLAWFAHVRWRDAALVRLDPVVHQIDLLRSQVEEDDRWISLNGRLFQEYGRHGQFAERVRARGNRAAAHDALVDSYNREVTRLFRRFYLAPAPPPEPPLRTRLTPLADAPP